MNPPNLSSLTRGITSLSHTRISLATVSLSLPLLRYSYSSVSSLYPIEGSLTLFSSIG